MSAKFFGQFLLERRKILKEELLDALEFQKSINVKLGTIALDAGYLSAEQIEQIHSKQQQTDKLFGEIALELKLLTPQQLDELLLIQKNERITLGEALLQKGYITLSSLEEELGVYKQELLDVDEESFQAVTSLPHPEIAEVFLELTIKFLRRLGDLEVKVDSSHNNRDKIAPYMWNVYQQFYGDVQGTYVISLSDEPLLKIASNVSQQKLWEVDDFAKDAMRELANIIVGNTASKLSKDDDINISLQPSKVVTSLGNIEIPKESTQTAAIVLVSHSYSLQMSVIYSDIKSGS